MRVLLLVICPYLTAAQVITTHDQVQLNWSTLELTFPGMSADNTFTDLEKKAWQDGLGRLQKSLPHIYSQQGFSGEQYRMAASHVFRSLYLRDTVFFSDHRVRISFIAFLPRVFTVPALSFRSDKEELPPPRNSGLVMLASSYFHPRAVYRIEGKSGHSYFDVTAVQKKYFTRNLMGRYFVDTTPARLSRFIGNKPHVLPVREKSPAVLEVDDTTWKIFSVGNGKILATATIAVIFPSNSAN